MSSSSSFNPAGEESVLPPGWSKVYSNSQKRHYYFHAATKHTQWHFPTASEVADPLKAKQRAEENERLQRQRRHQQQQGHGHGHGHGHGGAAQAALSASDAKKRPPPQSPASKRPHRDYDDYEKEEGGLGHIVSTVTPLSSSSSSATTAATGTATGVTPTTKRPRRINNTNFSAVEPTLALADLTSIAIIVPYRDLHPNQNRAKHLSRFVPHMNQFLSNLRKKQLISNYHIYIIEQSNDGRKFNRGKLLNIGFDLARKIPLEKQHPHDVFVFHDVDLLPHDNLASWYAKFPKSPIHIARVWDRYSNNPKYFGGIVSFSAADMKRINGYPNTFWGWGGEDDEMQNRCERLGIRWEYPSRGTIVDLEGMNLKEKLDFLRQNRTWKCMVKWEALEEHEKTWRMNGLADLRYEVLKKVPLDVDPTESNDGKGQGGAGDKKSYATKITVDVKLNGNHWSNEKCGVDYVWSDNKK